MIALTPLRLGRHLAVAVTLLGLAPAALAEPGDSFVCDMDAGGPIDDAFPEVVGVYIAEDAIYVMDPIINNYYGEPLEAKVISDNDSRLSVRWVVKVKDEETGRSIISLQYELMILKQDLSARIRLKKATGDSLEFKAMGTCKRERW